MERFSQFLIQHKQSALLTGMSLNWSALASIFTSFFTYSDNWHSGSLPITARNSEATFKVASVWEMAFTDHTSSMICFSCFTLSDSYQ